VLENGPKHVEELEKDFETSSKDNKEELLEAIISLADFTFVKFTKKGYMKMEK